MYTRVRTDVEFAVIVGNCPRWVYKETSMALSGEQSQHNGCDNVLADTFASAALCMVDLVQHSIDLY